MGFLVTLNQSGDGGVVEFMMPVSWVFFFLLLLNGAFAKFQNISHGIQMTMLMRSNTEMFKCTYR